MRKGGKKTVMVWQVKRRRRLFGTPGVVAAGTAHAICLGTYWGAAGFGNSHSIEHIQYYCPDRGLYQY
jgi:hypothetical protein